MYLCPGFICRQDLARRGVCVHVCVCVHMCVCVRACVHMSMRACVHPCVRAFVHACVCVSEFFH